jgi:hypothetical protein
MLTDFVVVSPEEAAAVSANQSRSSTWPCFKSNGLDNSTVAALWSALDPSTDASSLEGETHLIHSKQRGTMGLQPSGPSRHWVGGAVI